MFTCTCCGFGAFVLTAIVAFTSNSVQVAPLLFETITYVFSKYLLCVCWNTNDTFGLAVKLIIPAVTIVAFCVAFAPAASELINAYPLATVGKAAGFKAATGPALAFVEIVHSPPAPACGGVPVEPAFVIVQSAGLLKSFDQSVIPFTSFTVAFAGTSEIVLNLFTAFFVLCLAI